MKKSFKILLLLLINLIAGCNFCPTNPNNSVDSEDLLVSYYSESTSNVLVLSNSKNLNFRELISDALIDSPPAENGDYCFIKKNYNGVNSALFLGNIYNNSTKFIEVENSFFSISNPVISPKSNKIAFSGGKNQLFLWVYNPSTKSSYIDKISDSFISNSSPKFSNDGNLLCYLEQTDNVITLNAINAYKPDEVLLKIPFYGNFQTYTHNSRISISNNNLLSTILFDETKQTILLIDLNTKITKQYILSKNVLTVKNFDISNDGKSLGIVAIDGSLWVMNTESSELKLYQLTTGNDCAGFSDIKWSKNNNTFLVLQNSCGNNTKNLRIVEIQTTENEVKVSNNLYHSSNVINAFWR